MVVTPRTGTSGIGRIFVAFDHRRQGQLVLAEALALAGQAQAEVVVLFVEDESLLRLASLPFAHEINRTSGMATPLDADVLSRQMARQVQRLSRLVAQSAESHQITASVRVVRGHLAEQALAAAGDSDVVFINVQDRIVRTSTALRVDHSNLLARARADRAPHKSIAVLFDGSPAATRAIYIARQLGTTAHIGLVVALEVDDAVSRQRASRLLDGYGAPVRFVAMDATDAVGARAMVRNADCSMLVIPANHSLTTGRAASRLIEMLGCPVVLTR